MMLKSGVASKEPEDTKHAFNVFDRNGDGLISAEELKAAMNNLGEPITEGEVNMMILEADVNGDGQIDFEEFKILLTSNLL